MLQNQWTLLLHNKFGIFVGQCTEGHRLVHLMKNLGSSDNGNLDDDCGGGNSDNSDRGETTMNFPVVYILLIFILILFLMTKYQFLRFS